MQVRLIGPDNQLLPTPYEVIEKTREYVRVKDPETGRPFRVHSGRIEGGDAIPLTSGGIVAPEQIIAGIVAPEIASKPLPKIKSRAKTGPGPYHPPKAPRDPRVGVTDRYAYVLLWRQRNPEAWEAEKKKKAQRRIEKREALKSADPAAYLAILKARRERRKLLEATEKLSATPCPSGNTPNRTPEHILEANRAWREANKEHNRDYRRIHRQKRLQQLREWKEQNPEATRIHEERKRLRAKCRKAQALLSELPHPPEEESRSSASLPRSDSAPLDSAHSQQQNAESPHNPAETDHSQAQPPSQQSSESQPS